MFRDRSADELFPTRIYTFDLDAHERLDRELARVIREKSRELPTFSRGERTGWQSDNSFFDWCDAAGALRHAAFTAVRSIHPSLAEIEGMSLPGWANLLGAGDFFSPHSHGGAAWSGVYWVEVGASSPEAGGMFSVLDPRAGAGMVESPLSAFDSASSAEMQPVAGRMLVFPGWLVHWVTPYRGGGQRISVAFNAR